MSGLWGRKEASCRKTLGKIKRIYLVLIIRYIMPSYVTYEREVIQRQHDDVEENTALCNICKPLQPNGMRAAAESDFLSS